MSKQEFERAVLVRKVLEKRLTQRKAAEILGLSLRQIEYAIWKHRVKMGVQIQRRSEAMLHHERSARVPRDRVSLPKVLGPPPVSPARL